MLTWQGSPAWSVSAPAHCFAELRKNRPPNTSTRVTGLTFNSDPEQIRKWFSTIGSAEFDMSDARKH